MDVDAASIMSSCTVHDEACLNTSDHLPISVKLDIPTDSVESPNASMRYTACDTACDTVYIARNFRGLKFSRFSRINDEPQKFYPPNFYP